MIQQRQTAVTETRGRFQGVGLALTLLVGTRLPILLIGAVAVTIVGTIPPPVWEGLWRVSPDELTNLLARWDTYWYYSIATQGYHWDPDVFARQNVAFFPLLPTLMHAGAALTGLDPLLVGLLINLAAFTLAMVILYRLAMIDLGEQRARWALILLAAYPFALFFSAVYTEALFLLAMVGAVYALRTRAWTWACLCGLAAGLLRPHGTLLVLPLAFMAWRPREPHSTNQQRVGAWLAALSPAVGTAIFVSYLQLRFGDGLAFLHAQRAWGLQLIGQASVVNPSIASQVNQDVLWRCLTGVGLALCVVTIVACWDMTRRFEPAYGLLLAVIVIPAVLTHLLQSFGRYTAVAFPLFFWLAQRLPPRWLRIVAIVFAAGQGVLAALFFLWYVVF
jgi:hypothetical protein